MKSYYTIEEKAKREYGVTSCPELALYLLKDGTFLNGSYEGYQRDRDHREISEFFTTPKNIYLTYDSTWALIKMIKRGNMRWHYNSYNKTFNIEFDKLPTKEQFLTLKSIHQEIREGIYNSIFLEKMHTRIAFNDFYDFEEWLNDKVNYYLY